MTSTTVVLVSDSHLSPRTPEATANWEVMLEHVAQTKPAAVVHTGDIALDGASDDDDLRFAKTQLDRSAIPILALPGNHDLGDNPCETNAGATLITSERLASYRQIFGVDRWTHDLESWRLIGCNAQLFGSGLDEEDEQWSWLENQLAPASLGDRHVAFFQHKPLLHSDPQPEEHDVAIRYVRREPRERLLALLEAAEIGVVVSGHVHQHRRLDIRGIDTVWAPTSWATIPPSMQDTVGERWVGGLELQLHDDGRLDVVELRPDNLGQHSIGEDIPNPYGAH